VAIYLDYNATTPVDPAVLDAMLPHLRGNFANASSVHSPGQRARAAVDEARESVAALIGAKAAEVVFTSGGTEADNLAIFGVVAASNSSRRHVITTSIEHHAVLQACQALEKQGVDVTYIEASNPSREGVVDPEAVRRAVRPETVLITVMHANNELGTTQPVEEIGRIAHEAGILFHCDAVRSERICSRFPHTRFTDRRASAPFMCARVRASSPCFEAGNTSAACAPAPKT
jgi:cysteine desulfurase